ncbi:MAG: PKD domain-containing protein [bacterium]
MSMRGISFFKGSHFCKVVVCLICYIFMVQSCVWMMPLPSSRYYPIGPLSSVEKNQRILSDLADAFRSAIDLFLPSKAYAAPPVADAGGPYEALEGSWHPITFDGSGSTADEGIAEYHWDFGEYNYTFDGTQINDDLWVASSQVTQNDEIVITGANNWGSTYFFSKYTYQRDSILEASIKTPSESTQYLMVGFKQDNETYHYNQMTYAIYFNSGAFYIYEDGSNRGWTGYYYTSGQEYEVRIELKKDMGALYYFREKGTTEWILLYNSNYSSLSPLKVGCDVYYANFSVDDIKLISHAYGPIVTIPIFSNQIVTLTVTDNIGQSASDTTTVSVQIVTGAPPVANPGGPYTFGEAFANCNRWTVPLDGTGSTDDYQIRTYQWSYGDYTHTFDGTEINNNLWIAPLQVTQNNEIIITGASGWGTRYFFSKHPYQRDSILEVLIKTPSPSYQNLMVGFKRDNENYHYNQMTYAIYFASGSIYIYEDGGNRGGITSYTQGEEYEVRIELKRDAGALYYFRENGASEWSLLYDSVYSTLSSFRVGADVYSDSFALDNLKVTSHAYGPTPTISIYADQTISLTVDDYAGQTATGTTSVALLGDALPVADPGGPYTFDEEVASGGQWSALVNGSSSTDDHGICTYEWDFGDGGTGTGISPIHQYSKTGTYTLSLTVTDHAGQTHTSGTTLTILDNDDPAPSIAAPEAVGEENASLGCWSVDFDASGSTDDFGIWRYEWDFGDGSTGTGQNITHSYCAAGTYTVTLTVYDHAEQSVSTTTTIHVQPGGLPVSDAGGPYGPIESGQPVTFDGTGSTDDFGITEYFWDFGEFIHTFDGTQINYAQWAAPSQVIQDNEIILTGAENWGTRYFFSRHPYPRGSILEAVIKTPDTSTQYLMVGFKRDNAIGHYDQMPYAIYFINGSIYIYEDGDNRGYCTYYTRGLEYEVRIELKKDAGALYYFRERGVTDWTLIYNSNYGNLNSLRIGVDVHTGSFAVDDIKLINHAYGPTPTVHIFQDQTVILTVTDNAGQTDSDTPDIDIDIGAPPQAEIAAPDHLDLGIEGIFDASSSTDDYGIGAYLWDFGDGDTADGKIVYHFYSSVGTHTVTLKIYDYAGQFDIATKTVEVSGENLVVCVPWQIVGGVKIPHDTWSGNEAVLKAVAKCATVPIEYTWDFGDGTSESGTITNASDRFTIEARHIYTGSDGEPFIATVTITDDRGVTASDTYQLIIRPKTLEIEENVAIDNGLWWLYKNQIRDTWPAGTYEGAPMEYSYWTGYGSYVSQTASVVQAFLINGHMETGDPIEDPYVETVRRGMRYVFTILNHVNIGPQTYGDPDTNGNGIGLEVSDGYPIYQGGMVMDVIAAAGTPDAIAQTGGINVCGRTYRDILTDMVDMYAWGQDDYPSTGGWRYNWNSSPDNSASQWGAIGLLAAEEIFGITIPQWVKERNDVWLNSSYNGTGFGYTGSGNGVATTPSGMIQLAFCDKTTSDSRWQTSEDWIANNWTLWLNQNNIYAYYAFTKAMRTAQPQEIVILSATGFDWFNDEHQGLARYLMDLQQTDLGWPNLNFAEGGFLIGRTFSTAWSIIILTRTLFVKPPVALIHASPNPGAVGQEIRFDASASYHLDPYRNIVAYQWDFDVSDGLDWEYPDATGRVTTHTYGELGDYTVTLRVLDDNVPERMDTDIVIISITIPPHPPTANADGPYITVTGESVTLDGSGSYDINEPEGDSITAYGWEIDMIAPRDFEDAAGVSPTVSGYDTAGTYPIGLRVTDNTEDAFPSSGSPNLTDEDFTEVIVYNRCINDLYVRPKGTKASLVWTHIGVDEYKIYRSERGPNIGMALIGTTSSTYSTFMDYNVELYKDYWYRVQVENDNQICMSHAYHINSQGRIRNRPPEITSIPPLTIQEDQLYSYDVNAEDPDGHGITYILDQAPDGMSIDETTGLIEWTPVFSQMGPNDVTIRAMDELRASSTQFFTIIVSPRPNEPPVADPDGPYSGLRDQEITFDGSGSFDPEGDLPLTYHWNLGDGMTSTEESPIHVYTASGLYIVTLFVTDSRGATGSAETTAQIDEPNRIPTADAGGPYTGHALAEITFDGSGSYDPDDDPLTYTWNFGDSTPPETGVTVTHIYETEGTYNVSLTIDDGRSGIDTDSVDVVISPPNELPDALFTGNNFGNVGDEFTFDASASSDPDGEIISYEWDFDDGSTTTGMIVTHVYNTPGHYTVSLTVTDDDNAEDTATLEVNINAPPEITSTPETTALEDSLYTYDAEADDQDGDTLTYSLTQAPSGMTIDDATGLVQWTPVQSQVGDNPVTILVNDGKGRTATQSFVIVVQNVNDLPQITYTPPPSGAEGMSYTFQVQATDEDDTELTFSLDASPDGMTIGTDSGLISWTPSAIQAGSHTVKVRVTDPTGAFVIQDYVIEVAEALNAPPVVTLSPVVTGVEGEPYVYDIEVVDPEGDTITFNLITAPEGMTIQSDTGLVEWVPAADQSGVHDVLIRIDDGRGGIVDHGFTITVAEALNMPPQIVSSPYLNAVVDYVYTYQAEANDPDGDSLIYSLTTAPDGMNIDSVTGEITWTPIASQQGDNNIVIQVDDGRGSTATQPYTLFVRLENQPPAITSTPPINGTEGQLYMYDVEATDPEGDPITFSLVVSPSGMTIDSGTGLISWMPEPTQVGDYAVEVRVVDHFDGEGFHQVYTLTIADGTPPTVTVTVEPDRVNLGEDVIVTVTANDNVGVVDTTLTVDGAAVPLVGNQAIYTTITVGRIVAQAIATDDAGLAGTGSFIFIVIDPEDTDPPVVNMSLEEGQEITAPTEITGTVDDPGIEFYTLEYAKKGTDDWIVFATGTGPVIDDVLGEFDPTMLTNGLYDIRLTATDFSGNSASTSVTCIITGDLKAGINRITFTDLQVPVSGIPITVRRTYDSRVKTKKDFGVGWSVDILDVELSENQTPGDDWYAVNTGSTFFPNWELRSSKIHLVLVRFPDGKTDVFEMKAYFDDPVSRTGNLTYVTFEPRTGTTSTLQPYDAGDYQVLTGWQLLDWNTWTLYDPDRYLLTKKDGTKMVINQETGLESIEDLNGNRLIINSSGIVHSSGKSIVFDRDEEGRITSITDPLGNVITYSCDVNGDLVQVMPRIGYVVTMTYDDDHNLLDIINVLDEPVFGAEYDEEGRLVATRDAQGNRIDLRHELEQLRTVVTDRLGHPTVYRYDQRGNVVSETDPLGNTKTYTYDARDNLLTETDPLGNTTTYTYDDQDNLLTTTDPLGNVTTYTYNSRGQILTITDPLGNTTTNSYGSAGNLITSIDQLSNVWTYTYDVHGNRISETDPGGNTTSYEYNSYGWLTKQTSPCCGETRYFYDENGNKTQQIVTRTTASGPEEIMTQFEYDVEGRLINTTYADALSATIEYDVRGNKQADIDQLGRRRTYTHTPIGSLSRITYPDGTTQRYTYDAKGQHITSTDAGGYTTTYVYDALGRTIQTIYADDALTSTAYDAAGRIALSTDARGNTTTYVYDAADRRISTINALGETTLYNYDAAGRLLSTVQPNGQIYSNEYDAKGRVTKTIYPDGTFEQTTYDFADREISKTDQAGLTTNYSYDAGGRLTQVIDALGQTTSYAYDELGNRLSQTDAKGQTTTWVYDAFGREIQHTLPLWMSETRSYNAVGSLLSKTDFNGNTTTYTYNNRNRRTGIAYPDGSTLSFTYTSNGKLATTTDARGVTAYTYDDRGRLIQRTDPDGIVVAYTYDKAGNRTSVTTPSGSTTYTYDALNRLQSVTDPDGGVTGYEYDTVGNLVTLSYPNGTVAAYEYDSLNRLISVQNRRSDLSLISSYTYTLGPAGNRLQVVEHTGRTVDYSYDALYRLTQ